MATVKMRTYISGGRGDGTDWPHAGGTLLCGDGEARDLVRGELADWADDVPASVPPDSPEPVPAPTDDPPADGEPQDPDDGSAPLVRDPKQAWIDHAVAQVRTPLWPRR